MIRGKFNKELHNQVEQMFQRLPKRSFVYYVMHKYDFFDPLPKKILVFVLSPHPPIKRDVIYERTPYMNEIFIIFYCIWKSFYYSFSRYAIKFSCFFLVFHTKGSLLGLNLTASCEIEHIQSSCLILNLMLSLDFLFLE